MNKLVLSLVGLLSASLVFAGVASAATTGQIEGGDIYRVRNVSTNGEFTDPATGTCGNTFQFKVRIHNIGAYALENVKVSASLPSTSATSHSSKVTVSASNANEKTDTAGINLDKTAKISYVAGSTELLDAHNSKLQTLADGITTGGVNLPSTIGVSTEQKRFVQFSVKIDCPDKPKDNCPVPGKEHLPKDSPECKTTPPTTPPETPKTPKTPVTPAELPATGAADVIAKLAGVVALTGASVYYVASRRN